MSQANPKVLVSGFFDHLHEGHLDFLESAAEHGELYVSVGSDENFYQHRGSYPLETQRDRVRMLNALSVVHQAIGSSDLGPLEFRHMISTIKPDLYVINQDGHHPQKKALCEYHNVQYLVIETGANLETISPEQADNNDPLRIQYRLCLAGGWLDQPFVSKHYPGLVHVVSIEPLYPYADRCGMATSTRKVARRIWNEHIPNGNHETIAKLLFGAENPPGTEHVSGSQDAIGLVYPGMSRLDYDGHYWPKQIENLTDPFLLDWLDQVIHIMPTFPRKSGYSPYRKQCLNESTVKKLAEASALSWEGATQRDIEKFGAGLTATFHAYQEILPDTIPDDLKEQVNQYQDLAGRNITGAGGGGYLMLIHDQPIEGQLPFRIRRNTNAMD